MSKETGGFFRKVVRFVANPTTEWSSLDTQEAEAGESESSAADQQQRQQHHADVLPDGDANGAPGKPDPQLVEE